MRLLPHRRGGRGYADGDRPHRAAVARRPVHSGQPVARLFAFDIGKNVHWFAAYVGPELQELVPPEKVRAMDEPELVAWLRSTVGRGRPVTAVSTFRAATESLAQSLAQPVEPATLRIACPTPTREPTPTRNPLWVNGSNRAKPIIAEERLDASPYRDILTARQCEVAAHDSAALVARIPKGEVVTFGRLAARAITWSWREPRLRRHSRGRPAGGASGRWTWRSSSGPAGGTAEMEMCPSAG